MLVATTHWLYMTLRRLGRDEEAKDVLVPITKQMHVIENMAYFNLCLFYKGERSQEEFIGTDFTSIMNDAVAYGLGNWYYYNNDPEKSIEIYHRLLQKKSWASFGYIAAEADYSRMS
jgi:hypothetical protein